MARPTNLHDYIFVIMRRGDWWTLWDLQKQIHIEFGKWYETDSISCSIRDFRKDPYRIKYGLPLVLAGSTGNHVERPNDKMPKVKRTEGKGYKYRLN